MGAEDFDGMGVDPHRWQCEAHDRVFDPVIGIRSRKPVLVQACTGAGKTVFQASVVRRVLRDLDAKSGTGAKDWRVIVSVPKRTLVDQTVEEFTALLGRGWKHGLQLVGRWFGDVDHVDARIIVVCHNSLPSLVDYLKAGGLRVAFWLFDEVHKATGRNDVRDAVDELKPITQLAVTATLKPGGILGRFPDGSWATMKQVYSYNLDLAIRDGVLVPFRLVLPTEEEEGDTNEGVISMIRRGAPPGPILVDATDKKDAEWYAEVLTANGIPADYIHSGLGKKRRDALMADLLAGKIRALVQVDLLTEGVDVPGARTVVMRRLRGSAVAIVQFGGRVLRPIRKACPTLDWAGPKEEGVIILPHATPWLRAVATTTHGLGAAEALVKAAKDEEPDEAPVRSATVILPPMEAAPLIGDWLERLAGAVRERGVPVEAPYRDIDGGRAWRTKTPSIEQTAKLMGIRKKPERYLPEPHRKVVKKLLARHEAMNAGQTDDMIRMLKGLRQYGGIYWGKHHDYAPVLAPIDIPTPDAAVSSMIKHLGKK